MAKWGEGDPRWIVEERPDATNVNNWHWTEKNADSWSKSKLNFSSTTLLTTPRSGMLLLRRLRRSRARQELIIGKES